MTPINDRIVVKPQPVSDTTKGGIIIPDTAKEKSNKGTVVAVGPGKDNESMQVSVGKVVLYGQYAGQEFSHEGEDLLVMRQDDLLLILD